jgi:hypothetical protein
MSYSCDSTSDVSNVSETKILTSSFECYYCVFITSGQGEDESDVVNSHPGRLCYPNKSSLIKLGIQPKGRWK